MKSGDWETNYAYACFARHHWSPHKFTNLSREEKACVIAFIDEEIEAEKKLRKKVE